MHELNLLTLANKKQSESTKRILFAIYGILAAAIPYLCRLFVLGMNHYPEYYKSELDLFFFSLALSIALFAEIKNFPVARSGLIPEVLYSLFTVFVCFLGIAISFSLSNEYSIYKLDIKHLECLENKTATIEETIRFGFEKAALQDIKGTLFTISILSSLVVIIGCYKLIYTKNNAA